MGLVTLTKGQIIHHAGKDKVEQLEILVKGSIDVSGGNGSIHVGIGGVLGLMETPGEPYLCNYIATEDANIYTYPYSDATDIHRIVRSNPKISAVLTAQCIQDAYAACQASQAAFDTVKAQYEQLLSDREAYPILAARAGVDEESFPEMENLTPPTQALEMEEWEIESLRILAENDARLRKNCYVIAPEVALIFVMSAYRAMQAVADQSRRLAAYQADLSKQTAAFTTAIRRIHAHADAAARGEASSVVIIDALETILKYANADEKVSSQFREAIKTYKQTANRTDGSDETRLLRRNVTAAFYPIYARAFLRSLEDMDTPIPPAVEMFFMFGFVDEELAGAENTQQLYEMMKTYRSDPKGRVLTVYEWLMRIYDMELEPSRNEFDEDFPTALRSMKNNGDISASEAEVMLRSPRARLEFEIKNLFSLGNRMTFGRISSFIPIFDSENATRPLDSSCVTAERIHEFYNWIRSVDYSVFCRQGIYSNPEIGVNQVILDEEVIPYMILMPNMGSRAALWQEIEGKKRSTPGRFIISIFHTENLTDVLTRLAGEFRWEMCKTEQGVHWNDVTDPSLTSSYCDYLQFYKKNHSLSADMKDKLHDQLKKYNNNFKNVFISDYANYIKYESSGSPRLNKIAREILFENCAFSKEIREKLMDNPQYTELINRHKIRIANASKPLQNLSNKLQRENIPVPRPLLRQLDFYNK
ncbi:MAG: hypothetical protein IJT34_02215 [Butyrivibrio sp.]|nr:hypothetical protein [Butyrivibrio sp.]